MGAKVRKHRSVAEAIVLLAIFGLSPGLSYADEIVPKSGIQQTGLPGLYRLGPPTSESRELRFVGNIGYAFMESIGDASGFDHRVLGNLGAGYSFLEHLSAGINLTLKYDNHPDDTEGSDYTVLLEPQLHVRGGIALSPEFELGAELGLWVPGGSGVSMEWDASTLDAKLLAALTPSDHRWKFLALTGFRWDNSAHSAPNLATLREGDRISLGLSDYNAILAGIGASYHLRKFEFLGEFTADFLLGNEFAIATSPMRLNLGARYHLAQTLAVELISEVSLSMRPSLTPDDPLIPIEPRFTLLAGVSYKWDFNRTEPAGKAEKEIPGLTIEPPKKAIAKQTVGGVIIDGKGQGAPGVNVRIIAGEHTAETTTDQQGRYVFADVPLGPAKLEAWSEEFELKEWDVSVEKVMPDSEPVQVSTSTAGSVVKGLILSSGGRAVRARVVVEPLGLKTDTDKNGRFSLDVPAGEYTLRITSKGYRPQKRQITVDENSAIILNIEMWRKMK